MEARPQVTTQTISVQEAATLLGVSPATVRKAIDAGQMPGRRVGRVYRIHRASLNAWLTTPLAPRTTNPHTTWS